MSILNVWNCKALESFCTATNQTYDQPDSPEIRSMRFYTHSRLQHCSIVSHHDYRMKWAESTLMVGPTLNELSTTCTGISLRDRQAVVA